MVLGASGLARSAVVILVAAACALGAQAPSASANGLTLTVLYDNNPFDPRLTTADGFSVLIEGLQRRILFDTGGSGAILLRNMGLLSIDPRQIDIVVLSHIHNDHVGGLAGLLGQAGSVRVYVLSSFPLEFKQRVRQAGADVVEVSGPTEITDGAHSTGELGVAIKEQALVLKTAAGLVVITGCAHPGVVNMVARAQAALGGEVRLVMGGFHQRGMKADVILEVIARLKAQGVRQVGPGHCSGDLSRRLFREAYGEDFIEIGVGRVLRLADG